MIDSMWEFVGFIVGFGVAAVVWMWFSWKVIFWYMNRRKDK